MKLPSMAYANLVERLFDAILGQSLARILRRRYED